MTGVPCRQMTWYTTPLLVSNTQPGSIPSESVPRIRTVELCALIGGGLVRSSGDPVGVLGIGLFPVVEGAGAGVEFGAEVVGAELAGVEMVGVETLLACSTVPHAASRGSAKTAARARAMALVIPVLTPSAPFTFLRLGSRQRQAGLAERESDKVVAWSGSGTTRVRQCHYRAR